MRDGDSVPPYEASWFVMLAFLPTRGLVGGSSSQDPRGRPDANAKFQSLRPSPRERLSSSDSHPERTIARMGRDGMGPGRVVQPDRAPGPDTGRGGPGRERPGAAELKFEKGAALQM